MLTPKRIRSRPRRTLPRARSIKVAHDHSYVGERAAIAAELADFTEELAIPRPTTRGECLDGGANAGRPCPWVSCRYNLYLDVSPETGSIKLVRPDLDVGDLPESCALDVADRGGHTLEIVGALLNITRERTRQIEVRGAIALKPLLERAGIDSADVFAHAGTNHVESNSTADERRTRINENRARRDAKKEAA